MEVMRRRADGRQLTGSVELDDGYLVDERSGGKAGRGSENKIPFITAMQTTESGGAEPICLLSCLSPSRPSPPSSTSASCGH